MAYWALSEAQAPAAASSGPEPGPALSNAECTSGGEAIQIGPNGEVMCQAPAIPNVAAAAVSPAR
ncbi:hypothetical protein PICSAR164_02094 [Mycobacterium avium subsp. paratuberculosis]|nr:hypothetical protein PICSAR164_02094 [Mycobacterium avium subsp. paratuberculosis]